MRICVVRIPFSKIIEQVVLLVQGYARALIDYSDLKLQVRKALQLFFECLVFGLFLFGHLLRVAITI